MRPVHRNGACGVVLRLLWITCIPLHMLGLLLLCVLNVWYTRPRLASDLHLLGPVMAVSSFLLFLQLRTVHLLHWLFNFILAPRALRKCLVGTGSATYVFRNMFLMHPFRPVMHMSTRQLPNLVTTTSSCLGSPLRGRG